MRVSERPGLVPIQSNCSRTWEHLKAHRLHPPGDFCLKERVNVNDSADYFGAIGVGRVTHVAVQHRRGIFSERRAGSRACDFADSGTDGASLVGSSTGSLATPWKLWSNC